MHWQVPAVLAVDPTQVLLAKPPLVVHGQVKSIPLGPSGKALSGPVEHFEPTPPPAK